MLEVDYKWSSTGSSGGLTPLYVSWPPTNSVIYATHSTLASTQSCMVQTADASSGPWATEISYPQFPTATAAAYALRFTGPYKWIRPYLNSASTGTYTFRLVGND